MDIGKQELVKAKLQLQRAEKNMDSVIRECINEIALRVYRSVVRSTPVDTGFLRQEWTLGAIKKSGGYYQCEILNPVEYARYVEYGHRLVVGGVTVGWVDGYLMLTIAESEVKKRADKIIKRRLDRYYRGLFK